MPTERTYRDIQRMRNPGERRSSAKCRKRGGIPQRLDTEIVGNTEKDLNIKTQPQPQSNVSGKSKSLGEYAKTHDHGSLTPQTVAAKEKGKKNKKRTSKGICFYIAWSEHNSRTIGIKNQKRKQRSSKS